MIKYINTHNIEHCHNPYILLSHILGNRIIYYNIMN